MMAIDEVLQHVVDAEAGDMQTVLTAHALLLAVHVKAIACHCECLAMNSENAMAVCGNYTPPYNDTAYYSVMQKWELIDGEGGSAI